MNYTKAGVNEEKEQEIMSTLAPMINSTHQYHNLPRMCDEIGYFANIINMSDTWKLAVTTDGVGTKVLIADTPEEYETCGRDCVTNNINDLICVGADPLTFLDYIAVSKLDATLLKHVIKGMCNEAKQSFISISGGELAQVPDLLAKTTEKCSFDLVGCAIGIVSIQQQQQDNFKTFNVIKGNVQPGNKIIGIRSSGVHSNGYTLIRKLGLHKDPSLKTLLMKATTNYSFCQPSIRHDCSVTGIAHISGGGLLNLARFKSDQMVKYIVNRLPEYHDIFNTIKKKGNLSNQELFSTFNMGIGMCVVVEESDAIAAMNAIHKHKYQCSIIGSVEEATDEDKDTVTITNKNLIGKGDKFYTTSI